MWCRMIKFPSVILRPGTSWGGGGVDVAKGGVGLAIPIFFYMITTLLSGSFTESKKRYEIPYNVITGHMRFSAKVVSGNRLQLAAMNASGITDT